MKSKKVAFLITIIILCSSCAQEAPPNLEPAAPGMPSVFASPSPSVSPADDDRNMVANADSVYKKQIIWRADLNHNGENDKIIVTMLEDEDCAEIVVYAEETSVILYSANAYLFHAGWNGIYLYSDESGDYLLNWLPVMYQGLGNFKYEIFSFDENGDKIIFESDSYDFYLPEIRDDFKGLEEFIRYVQKVNLRLMSSSLIVDTNGGNASVSPCYGTQEEHIVRQYLPEWLFIP